MLFVFALGGYFAPKKLDVKPDSLLIFVDKPKAPPDSIKPMSFRESVQKAIPILKATKKRGNPVEVWTVGKGIALPIYLLRAQRQIIARKGVVVQMIELNNKIPSARLTWADSLGDSSTVEIRVGEAFLEGSSSLAIAFTVDSSVTPGLWGALEKLTIPLSLLVQPFDSTNNVVRDPEKWKDKEMIAWIAMEPHKYPWISPGPRPILIHHNDKDIDKILNDAFKRLPTAAGIATRMGERAVEHKPLLQALVHNVQERNLWFLDLTQSRFSRTMEVCDEMKVQCRMSSIMPSEKDPTKYLQTLLTTATKAGKAVAILPLTEANINAVKALLPAAELQGTEIVKLSELMNPQE